MNKINFEKLISPISLKNFFQTFWEKEYLHIKRQKADNYASILNINDLDNYLARHDLSPFYFRLYKNGNEIPSKDLIVHQQVKDGTLQNVIDPGKLFFHFCEGVTIIISMGEASIHNLSKFCRDLGQEFKSKFRANIYITPANSQGFLPHHDLRDVFILQIHGQKRWNLYESPEILPTKRFLKLEDSKITDDLLLKTGDLLYLPRGIVHSAYATDSPSIHITLSLPPFSGWNLLETLSDVSQEDLFFRSSIPGEFSDEKQRMEYSAEFFKKSRELLENLEKEKLFKKQYEEFVHDQFIDYTQHFTDLISIDQINLETTVRKRNLSYLIKHRDKEVILQFGKQELTFPKFLLATLQQCVQDEPFQIKSLKGLINNAGKIEIVKNLLKIGFLKVEQERTL